jgi:hypothetical protein
VSSTGTLGPFTISAENSRLELSSSGGGLFDERPRTLIGVWDVFVFPQDRSFAGDACGRAESVSSRSPLPLSLADFINQVQKQTTDHAHGEGTQPPFPDAEAFRVCLNQGAPTPKNASVSGRCQTPRVQAGMMGLEPAASQQEFFRGDLLPTRAWSRSRVSSSPHDATEYCTWETSRQEQTEQRRQVLALRKGRIPWAQRMSSSTASARC